MEISNAKTAKLLRNVAAAYTIKRSLAPDGTKKTGNIFEIRAYENAADSVEHSTVEISDLWEEDKLDQVPALGTAIRGYLDELFKTGKVKHFEEVQKGISEVVFDLLDIPGVGPKTAQKIAELGIKNINDLQRQIKSGELVKKGLPAGRQGFSAKLAQNLLLGINQLKNKTGRLLLPYAFAQAERILSYLKKSKEVVDAHYLGSLRRMLVTIGDLDFSVSSNNPKKVVEYFCKMSGIAKVYDKGEFKATVVLKSGLQLDLLVGKPNSYGALLQHFTGSKSHNIHLRTLAEKEGLSLSEHGVKKVDSGNTVETDTEEKFYRLLGMDVPPPEIREDTGEIEAALNKNLPDLVKVEDIKGDLHLHSNFPLDKPSHGPGINSIGEIVKKAQQLGYNFVGISDHSPSFNLNKEQIISSIEKRTKFIQSLNKNTNSTRVLNGLEIDILGDGNLSVPEKALETLDYCIAGIHSGHSGTKEEITKRLLSALNSPYVDIISHPTGRLLNHRGSSEADWDEIFRCAAENKKILEINSHPVRLDLRDDLVRQALKYGVKFIIDTDAHEITQMDNMLFGVSVARRGWATTKDIVNTWSWTDFAKWFKIHS